MNQVMTKWRSASVLGAAVAMAAAGCALPPKSAGQAPSAVELPPISPNRPTFSDGTSLVPVGHTQIETGVTFAQRTQAGVDTARTNVPEVVARYRVSDVVEVRALWGGQTWSTVDQGAGSETDDGGSDPAIGIVVPLAEQQGWLPAIAIEALTTLGVGSSDFSSSHADPTAKLLWSYGGGHLPEWLGIGGNFNVSYPTEAGDRFTQTAVSLYATFTPSGADTCWFAEWYLVGRPANHVDATQSADFGVVQRLNRTTAIDARIGFGLDDRADDWFTGIGISFLF